MIKQNQQECKIILIRYFFSKERQRFLYEVLSVLSWGSSFRFKKFKEREFRFWKSIKCQVLGYLDTSELTYLKLESNVESVKTIMEHFSFERPILFWSLKK